MKYVWLLLGLLLLFAGVEASARGFFKLPALPEPELYGNLLIDQSSSRNNMQAVSFSHWFHRQYFSCNVCHEEIGFAMASNSSDINETDNREGRFCGTCHNGLTAFAVTEQKNCARCHNADLDYSSRKFARFSRANFPAAPFGNRIDWQQALREGLIKPVSSLSGNPQLASFEKELSLNAEWNFVSPAIFSHEVHLRWMDCALCHPEPFIIKKKSTAHFRMREILKGNFCGSCHLKVAFPIDDCERCHPGME